MRKRAASAAIAQAADEADPTAHAYAVEHDVMALGHRLARCADVAADRSA
jgi:hypothetical protein